MQCEISDYCTSWTLFEDKCLINNYVVSPGDFGGTQAMFTNRKPGNLIGMTTLSAPTIFGGGSRGPGNLVKGLFNHDGLATCCVIYGSATPRTGYFKFDFATPTVVQEVTMMGHYVNWEPELPNENTKIYVIISGNWIELGNFPNGTPMEIRSFFQTPPKAVDAVAIVQEDTRALAICYVEIF